MTKNLKMDLGTGNFLENDFILLDKIIKDRGSVYSVSAGLVKNRDDIKKFIKKIRNYNKKFQKATHHSFAVRISKDGVIYETASDDGETGAGKVILRILQKKDYINTIACVTRWFGGVKLESDRFRHIQDAVVLVLNKK